VLNNRLKNALNLLDGKINQSDYRKLKEDHQQAINVFERKLFGLDRKKKTSQAF
jgi:hypothetical protein